MKHVFITGLPRSGTTLTRWIFQYAGYPVTNELHLSKDLVKHIDGVKNYAEELIGRQRWRHQGKSIDTGKRIDGIVRSFYNAFSDVQIYGDDYDVFINKTPNLKFNLVESILSEKPQYIICVRNPITNILSMCNSNFGKKYEDKSGIDDEDFEKSVKKTVNFYNKVEELCRDGRDMFFIRTDRLQDHKNRLRCVQDMFDFVDIGMPMDVKFPYEYKGNSGTLRQFLKEWPSVNAGDTENYQDFSYDQLNFLVGNNDIKGICEKHGYGIGELK